MKRFALDAVKKAVQLAPTANILDTLSCAYALDGEFEQAIETQTRVVSMSGKEEFRKRLAMFEEPNPRDCTGVDDEAN